jgi:hypothetical protein
MRERMMIILVLPLLNWGSRLFVLQNRTPNIEDGRQIVAGRVPWCIVAAWQPR